MNYKKYLILSSSVLISIFSFEGLAALPNNPDRCASQCTQAGCKKTQGLLKIVLFGVMGLPNIKQNSRLVRNTSLLPNSPC